MRRTRFRTRIIAISLHLAFGGGTVFANPVGPEVVSGNVSFAQPNAGTLAITNSPGAFIKWQDFSIATGETTRFIQQSAASHVVNQVVGQNLSQIFGTLQSNGRVFLINPNGILVGAGAVIDTAGFVASSLAMTTTDAGKLRFEGSAASGPITIERGAWIRTAYGGHVALIAPQIENRGVIQTPGGSILLAAGQKVTVVSLEHGDVQFEVQAPTDAVLNVGQLLADGGAVRAFAGSLKHSGEIRANALVRDAGGEIVLRAQQDVQLAAGSTTAADGRSGGSVTIASESGTARVGGTISAVGRDGPGGRVEITGGRVALVDNAVIDASGSSGGGSVLVGGDWQGANPDVRNADTAFVGAGVSLKADATDRGDGGKIVVWADGETRYLGSLSARGGANGGDGGKAEVSGKGDLLFVGGADLGAAKGQAGDLLLDPLDLFVDTRGGINPFIIDETTDFPGNAVTVSPGTLAAIVGNVTLHASRDMRFNSAVTLTGAGQGLTATAGRDMQLGAGISTSGGAVSLTAARNLTTFAASPISTGGGNVNLAAQGISAGALTIAAGTGTVNAASSAGSLSLGGVTSSGSIGLTSTGGNLSTGSLTSAGTITLNSPGSLSTGNVVSGAASGTGVSATSAGFLSTGSITTAGAAATLNSSGSSVGTGNISTLAGAGPTGGTVNITAGGSSASTGNINAGNANVTLSGTSVFTNTVTTTGNVSLTASAGSISSTVNDAASVSANASRSFSSTSVNLTSTSATTPLNATTVTATASNCSSTFSCPGASVTLIGNKGVNVGTVTASAPARPTFSAGEAVQFNSISESVTINGQNGPILAIDANSQVTAADVTLQTNQGQGGGIGSAATALRVNVERNLFFRPNGDFNVLLNGSGPNRLDIQLGVAAAGMTYAGTLSRAGQINLVASATDSTVTVADFSVSSGFDDLVFNNAPAISLNVPNGKLVATNIAVPAGDQTGRVPPFCCAGLTFQGLPVSVSARDDLSVGSYTRAAGTQAKSTSFSSTLGSVTLGTISADRDPVSISAATDVTLTTALTTRGNVTVNAAQGAADTGNVTIGGLGINTASGSGAVTINALSAVAGHGEIRAGSDTAALEITAGGPVTLNARNVDTAGFAHPLNVSAPAVAITTSGPNLGHGGAAVTANTQNLTINAAGNFFVDSGPVDLRNLTVTASPSGVGNGGLARVDSNVTSYTFDSDGSNFTLDNWTAPAAQFNGGTLSFTSTSGNLTLADIDFSASNGSLSLRTNQLVSGDVTQTPGSALNLGSGFLSIQADNNVSLDNLTAGGLSVSQANNQVFSPAFSNGACESIGFSFVCAPNTVTVGNITDPTGSGFFSITARHGISTGNLAVGDLDLFTYAGAVTTGNIGTAAAPAASVNITADAFNTGAGGSIETGDIEADNISLATQGGNIETGDINAVNTGAGSITMTAFTSSITTGNINASATAILPGSITLAADTGITTGTLDADQIALTGRCCTTFPAISTGAIGSHLAGSRLVMSGASITIGGVVKLAAAGTGQTLRLDSLGNLSISGAVSLGQGGSSISDPLRLSAGNLLTLGGAVTAANGSFLELHAGNTATATPFQFTSISAGSTGTVTIDAPAGIVQTLASASGGGITAGTVVLKATSAGATIESSASPLTLREATDLTLDAGGDVDIRLTGTGGAKELTHLDITRRQNDAVFALNDGSSSTALNSTQTLSVTDNGSGVDLGLVNGGAAPLNFRYVNADGGSNIVVNGGGIVTRGGFVQLEAQSGAVSSGHIDTRDATLGDGSINLSASSGIAVSGTVNAGSNSIQLITGGNIARSGGGTLTGSFVSATSIFGDIGSSGTPLAITAPAVSLTATRNLGPGVGGDVFASLTGTSNLTANADHGFTIATNTALTDVNLRTRGDQAGAVSLIAPGQSFGFTRNLTTLEIGSVVSPAPLSSLTVDVAAGNLKVIGSGASSIAADALSLRTDGILTLDGSTSRLVLANVSQDFAANGNLLVNGRATLTASGAQQFRAGYLGGSADLVFTAAGGDIATSAASQTLTATRDVVFQGGTASNEKIDVDATSSQSFSASRDIRLLGGSGDGATVGVGLSGDDGQSFSASRNIDLLAGSGASSSVDVAMTGNGNQTFQVFGGNINLGAGTGDHAAVTVSAAGGGRQDFRASGNIAFAGGGIAGTAADAAVTVSKSGSNTQFIAATGAVSFTGGAGDRGSVRVLNTGSGNQEVGDPTTCCSPPFNGLATDSVTLQGGSGADSFVLVEAAGRQFVRPIVALNLAGGDGAGSYVRIRANGTTSSGAQMSQAPQVIGYNFAFDFSCCSVDETDTISLTGGAGLGAFAEIVSAGAQRVRATTSLSQAGSASDGSYARIAGLSQDLRTGTMSLLAGSGDGSGAMVEATGSDADRPLFASVLQFVDPTALTLTGAGTAGGNTAAAGIVSGGSQQFGFAGTTSLTAGAGPDSDAFIVAATTQDLAFGSTTLTGGSGNNSDARIRSGNFQDLSFSSLTLQGGTAAGAAAVIESLADGQSISAGTTQLLGGSGATGAGMDAGATLINRAGTQFVSTANLTIRSGADFAPAGILNLGADQSVFAGNITVGTTAGANGLSDFRLGSNVFSGIVNRGTGAQSVTGSLVVVDNQHAPGDIGILTTTAPQMITAASGLRIQASGGSGSARVASPGEQTVSAAFIDINTGATATGNAELTAVGNQKIHTTNGTLAGGNGSLRVAALGSGTAKIESGGDQLLEIDYPELMQTARDGRITIGNAAALGRSLVKAVNQDIFARSIDVFGGSGAGADAKLEASNVQNISTLLAGIAVQGGGGGNAAIDPVVQNIVSNGLISVLGGSGSDVTGGITATGDQTILATLGDVTVTGGTADNSFAQITTSGPTQRLGSTGDIVLTPGSGTNADAIIGAGNGAGSTIFGCLVSCSPISDLPSNPFANATTDAGAFRNPQNVPLSEIDSATGVSGEHSPPIDPLDSLLSLRDTADGAVVAAETPEEERNRRFRQRGLEVCR